MPELAPKLREFKLTGSKHAQDAGFDGQASKDLIGGKSTIRKHFPRLSRKLRASKLKLTRNSGSIEPSSVYLLRQRSPLVQWL